MCTLCTEQRIRGADAPKELPNSRTLGIKGGNKPLVLDVRFFVFRNFMQRNLTNSERRPLKCGILEKNSNNFNISPILADYM